MALSVVEYVRLDRGVILLYYNKIWIFLNRPRDELQKIAHFCMAIVFLEEIFLIPDVVL